MNKKLENLENCDGTTSVEGKDYCKNWNFECPFSVYCFYKIKGVYHVPCTREEERE